MKKLIVTTLISSLMYAASFGQIMKSTTNRTNSVPLSKPIAAPLPTKPPVHAAQQTTHTPVKAVVVNQTTVKPVFLNLKNAAYKNKMQTVSHINPNSIRSIFAYSKTVNYADHTKVTVHLVKNPSFAGQSPVLTPSVKSSSNSSDNQMDCTSSVVSLSATSTDFMNNNYSSQTAHIYPGAIYTYDNLYNGSFKEENANRNPIVIGSDNPNMNGSTYEEVSDPNSFSIHNAIAKLYQRFTGAAANESFSQQVYEYANSSDFGLKVGAGASGYGFSVSNVFSMNNKQYHYYLTIDARKTLFSISTSIPDNGFFKTPVNASSPYVVIGNVSYGVRVLANLDFTFDSQEEADNLKASYSGYGVNANVDLNLLSKSSALSAKINAYIIGGPSSGATVTFTKDQLQTEMQNVLNNATYSNAAPVSYQLFDMTGSVIGAISATDQFTVRNCTPSNESKALQSPLTVSIHTGSVPGDNKDGDTHYSFGLFDQDGKQIAVYHDDSNTDAYAEGSNNTIRMVDYTNNSISSASLANFVKGGGHIHLNIAPNGHDTWKINQFTLNLNFDNDLKSPHKIQWTNTTMSQDARNHDFYFDKGLQPIQ